MSAVRVVFRGPAALAEVFVSLLEKQGLTVAWTGPGGAPTATVELVLIVSLASGEGSLRLRLESVVWKFCAQFPRVGIEVERDAPSGSVAPEA
jgi:hypothetical protein